MGLGPSPLQAAYVPVDHNGLVGSEIATVDYDAIVICTGSAYTVPIKPSQKSFALKERLQELITFQQKISNATNILINGGGLVGVELAAEIAWRKLRQNPQKISIISRSTLLAALPTKAGIFAGDWLRKHNVSVVTDDQIVYDQSCGGQDNGIIKTKKGRSILADLVIDCTGLRKESAVVTDSDRIANLNHLPDIVWPYTADGLIQADEFLQVRRSSAVMVTIRIYSNHMDQLFSTVETCC